MAEDFGDFEIEQDPQAKQTTTTVYTPARVRMPRNGEVAGIIVQRLGGNRMEVRCSDGKTRNCRVPGRFKRSLWLRVKDVVLVEPWEHDNEKGDVIHKYNPTEANQLRKRGVTLDTANDF